MKRVNKIILFIFTISFLVGCDPVEDRESLPKIDIQANEIDVSVTQDPQNPNKIILANLTKGVIPYWSYENAQGDVIGNSNKNNDTVTFPFAGVYKINFTAYTRGGAVQKDPITIKVASNNSDSFSDPQWQMLTNGVAGKKWVLDMSSPIGWCGLDYPWNASGSDFWNWFPSYNDASWAMPNKDWGSMTFDLNGNYNVSVTQTALNGNTQTTKKGSFSYDIANHQIKFSSGPELLYGGDYYPDVSNWTTVKVIEVSANSLRLAVVRDQSRTGEGVAQIMFHYKPAP